MYIAVTGKLLSFWPDVSGNSKNDYGTGPVIGLARASRRKRTVVRPASFVLYPTQWRTQRTTGYLKSIARDLDNLQMAGHRGTCHRFV